MSAHLLVMAGDHYYPHPATDAVFTAHNRAVVETIVRDIVERHDWILVFEIVHDGVKRYRMPSSHLSKIAMWEPVEG